MIRNRKQEDIRALLDLHTDLTDDEKLTLDKVYGLGPGPLLPDPIIRQPYDELYIKQKNSRDYWSRN